MDDEIDFATMTAYQLIDMLNAAYPHQCIQLGQSETSAHRYAGRREMIDELINAKIAEELARD
ncbi:MAG: hypothetical protein P4M09_17320 [Devosia sp.]|nr:hypothetical protein [Devosia sp.]